MNQNSLRIYVHQLWLRITASTLTGNQLYRTTSLAVLLLSSCLSAMSQGNYVVNTANNSSLGTYNTLLGPGAGSNGSLTGDRNAVTGYNAGLYLTSGNRNSFFGVDAGKFTTTGYENTFMGFEAGISNTSGSHNTMIGRGAGISNTTGGYNVFLGYMVGVANTRGSFNSFVGDDVGTANTTGSNNAFIGTLAGRYNTTGGSNSFLGYSASSSNTLGYANISIGAFSAFANQTGHNNVMIGDSTGLSTTTSNNVFVGSKAGFKNQNNRLNTYLGYQTGYNAVADSNTFVGYQAGYQITSGASNTFLGVNAGRNISTGSHNTIIGNQAGPASVNSDDNVYMGYNSGAHDQGSQNTLLGTQADVLATKTAALHHATAIGYGAVVSVSNAVVLGNQANVGIGTSSPTARLHVQSGQPGESGLRLENLTASSEAVAQTDKFLCVDESGRVVLARYRLQFAHPDEWADQVFKPGYSLRPLSEVGKYVATHQHLPGIPSAADVVKEGVDVAQLNARLLQKVEELTLYLLAQQKNMYIQQKQIKQLQTENRQIKRLLGGR